jgi:hypothetical protein
MSDRQWALSVLGVPEHASDSEIRTAYRDLVSIWHPDHHQGNERIRLRAEEMLKRINAARDILVVGSGSAQGWDAEPGDIPQEDESVTSSESHFEESEYSDESQEGSTPRRKFGLLKVTASGIIASLLVIWAFSINTERKGEVQASTVISASGSNTDSTPSPSTNTVPSQPKDDDEIVLGNYGQTLEATSVYKRESTLSGQYFKAKQYQYLVVKAHNEDWTKVLMSNNVWGYILTSKVAILPEEYKVKASSPEAILNRLSNDSQEPTPVVLDASTYLTSLELDSVDSRYGVAGRTTVRARVYAYGGEDEVLCRLEAGAPIRVDTTSRADWLAIALPNRNRGLIRTKQVALTEVASKKAGSTYERDPVPKDDSGTNPATSSFSIGSTMEQVKAVQGTPTSVASYGWSYGLSSVSFDASGKVDGYSNLGDNLKVQVTPSKPNRTKTRFSVGSTKDDVLLVQGTPTGVASYGWSYGLSSVSFDASGKVDGYSNLGDNLKVE